MVELAITREGHGAAERVRLKAHIGVRKEQPIPRRSFVGLLKSMGLAEPAFGKFSDVHDAEAVVSGGEVVKDARSGIAGAVVRGNDFEAGIIDFDESGEGAGQLFLFIASGEYQRNPRAIGIFCGGIALEPGQPHGAIGHAQAVGEPEESDEPEEEQPEKMHADWSREPASGYANTDAKEPCHRGSRTRGARAGAAATRIGLADWRGGGKDGCQRAEGGALHRSGAATGGSDPADFRQQYDSGVRARRHDRQRWG